MAFVMNASQRGRRRVETSPQGATGGVNKRDLASLLKLNQAVDIENFFVTGDGRLVAREGITLLDEVAGDLTPSMIEKLNDDTIMYGYEDGTDSHIAKYTISTDTSEILHTYSGITNDIDGTKYGRYFYPCNGVDGDNVGIMYPLGDIIEYDTETDAFTVGDVITFTGAATATVNAVQDNGTTGYLAVSDLTGTISAGVFTGAISGSATYTATLDYLELPNAPKCKYITTMKHGAGSHLLTGNTNGSESESKWSERDVNTGFPFYGWSFTSLTAPKPAEGYFTVFSEGGALNSIVFNDKRIYQFYDDAISVFHLENINVDTVGLIQNVVTDFSQENFGGNKAIGTDYGVFYCNENGIFQIVFGGTAPTGNPISPLLGEDLIEDLDFSDCDMEWDGQTRLLITVKKKSSVNNHVLVYDMEAKIWTSIPPWNMRRMCRIGKKMYGVDSSAMKLYELFNGYDDNGVDIPCRILFGQQTLGDPTLMKILKQFYIEGQLSFSSVVRIDFHTWNKKGVVTESKQKLFWLGGGADLKKIGYSKQEYSSMTKDVAVIRNDNFAEKTLRLHNILKYQIEILSSVDTPLEIHYNKENLALKGKRRLNNLATSL